MTDEPTVRSCEHFEPDPLSGTTCLFCGGNTRQGPSCWCPVFGEPDEGDEAE